MPKWLRQLIIFGAPLLVGLVNLAHPVHFEPTGVYHTIVDRVDWWITLHLINLVGFALLGLAVFLLVQERAGIAATVSKVAIAIYVPFYAGFDALIGLGTGTLVKQASSLTPAQFTTVEPVIDAFWNSETAYAVAAIGSIAWTIALLAAMIAFTEPGRRRWATLVALVNFLAVGYTLGNAGFNTWAWWGAIVITTLPILVVGKPKVVGALLMMAAALFGATHVVPVGPLGMACLLGAMAYLEFVKPKAVPQEPLVASPAAS
jgi:hypothetical protein